MSIAALSKPSSARPASARAHLNFLDGLRGLAALYVVVHHAYMHVGWRADGGGLAPSVRHMTNWLVFGHVAVDVFIVLSGFCLMLPLACSGEEWLRGGLGEFFKRRARRVLPPYYAALVLSLAIIALVPGMGAPSGSRWDAIFPAWTPGVLLSHLALVHNLRDKWIFKIDYPMWSVATEWQIYFVFALLLLPVWRRFGMAATVALAFLLGLTPHFVLHHRFDWACPWFLGLFALGMAGAWISQRVADTGASRMNAAPWGVAAFIMFAIFAAASILWSRWQWFYHGQPYAMDTYVGTMTLFLILHCTRQVGLEKKRSWAMALLSARGSVGLGVFSYSLYLVHAPVLGLLDLALRPFGLSGVARLALLIGVGVPLALGASYLFYLAFERPFLTARKRSGGTAALPEAAG